MNHLARRFRDPLVGSDPMMLPPVFSENPFAVLAKTDPPAATELLHRTLDQRSRELAIEKDRARMRTLQGISKDHTAQIMTFIQSNAGKGSVAASSDTAGVVVENSDLLFPRGQRVRMRTTFRGVAK